MKRMKRWLAMAMAVLIATSTLAGDYLIATAAELPASEEVVAEATTDVDADVEKDTEDTTKGDNPYEVTVYQQPTQAPTEAPVEVKTEPVVEATEEPVAEATPEATAMPETEAVATPEAVAEATPEVNVESTETSEIEATEIPEVAENGEVENISYPAIDFETKTVSGLNVTISAPEGAFPEGTEVYLSAVTSSSAKAMVADAVGEDEEVVSAKAVDITFKDKQGNEIQPLTAIKVSFSNANLSGEEFAVYHADDNGEVEKVSDCGSDGAMVEVSEFSIYIVVGTETPARITYNFYNDDNALLDSQIVKNGDNLYEPEVPVSTADAENEFLGWFDGDTRFSAFGTAQVDSTKITNLYAKYGKSYNVYFMNQYGNVQETKTVADKEAVNTSDVMISVGAAEAHVGWTLTNGSDATVSSVTVNGADVTLYPVIKTAYWVSFVSNGGSYVDAAYVFPGNTVAKPADPTRYGYEFAGWYSDEAFTKAYSFDGKVNADTTLYAKWNAQQVDYKIITWYENANDNGYSYGECEIKKANAGTVTNVQAKNYTEDGFTVQTIEQQTVAGDGSTVVNVYLNRNIYKIYFYEWKAGGFLGLGGKYVAIDKLTIEAKYGADIAELWPSRRYAEEYSAVWKVSENGSTYQAGISTMPLEGDSFWQYKGGSTKYTLRYELESLEQSGTYVLDHVDTFTGSSGLSTTKEDHYDIAGFTYTGNIEDGTSINGTITFRYDRNDYNIAFHNEEEVTTISKEYQADISNVAFTPERPATIPTEYVFKGWYDNKYGEGEPYDFTGKTMPANNLIFYAKWEAPTLTATFDVNGGNETIEAQTVAYNGVVTRPDDPTRDGYNFAGWTVNGKPFNFQTKLTKNVTLVANWIYSSSLQVAYDAGEGTNAPTDNKNYVEKSYAKVLNAATAPEGKVFLGWKVADAVYYPGDAFMINADDAKEGVITLVALYGDKPGATELTYYANNGTEVSETFDNIKNNSDVTVESVESLGFTYTNKRFVAWNTKVDGSGTSYQPGTTVAIDVIGTNQLYAQWEDDDAAYTVSWYDVETGEKLAASATRKDLVNATVSVTEEDKREFANYVLLEGTPSVFEGVVVRDGSLELKIYYAPVKTVTVTANSDAVIYNGQEQAVTGFVNETSAGIEVTVGDKVYYVSGLTAQAKGVDAGGYVTEISGIAVVKDADGNDVTNRFIVETENGTLTINQRQVTLTSATDEKEYDGTPLANDTVTVSGDGFASGEGATYTVTGTQIEVGQSGNGFDYSLNENTKAANYIITKVEGTLNVTPCTSEVVVYITGKKDSVVYNGSAQSVSGYDVEFSTPLYTEKDFSFGGTAIVTKTEVGKYPMGLSVEQFSNSNNNFTNVRFEVTDGELEITPAEVTVTITGHKATKVYSGAEQSVTGYDVVISESTPAYTVADFAFSGDAVAKGTDVETYAMGLTEKQFTNNNANFNVTFEVTDGELKITPLSVKVTVEGNKETKTYNGKEQKVEGYTVKIEDASNLYQKDYVAFTGEAVAKGTDVDSYPMGLEKGQFSNNNSNFDVTFVVEDGSLTIEKLPVKVTVTGKTDSKPYNGEEQKVEGYEVEIEDASNLYQKDYVTFTGEAVAKGTDVGSYPMGLEENQFSNNNDNFDVSFVINDGNLVITQEEVVVIIAGKKDSKVYSGKEEVAEGYEVTDISNALYTEDDFTFFGEAIAKGTDVGTYPMGLTEGQFANNNGNFIVRFEVTDGELEITKKSVTVTITGNKDSLPYNGMEQEVEGYEVSINDELYKETDFTFAGTKVAKGTDVNTYPMGLKEEQFKNNNDNFAVTFNVTDGELEITPLAVTVDITGNTDSKVYSGEEQKVEDYEVSISDAFYTENDITFSGEAVAEGTDVAKYPMGLKEEQFTNTNKNFNVTFNVTDGELEITPLAVTVDITGNTDSKVYSGAEQKVEGYKVSISDALYTDDDFTFSGKAVAEGTDVEKYPMGLEADQFTNNNANFDVTFNVVTDGQLEITKKAVTMTSDSSEKVYDGKPLMSHMVTATGFVDGEGATYNVTGIQTEVGNSKNYFTYTLNANTKAVNYDITIVEGTLTVTPLDAVEVTIVGNKFETIYDGAEHKAEGYTVTINDGNTGTYSEKDFTFKGSDVVAKTDAGIYTMGLTASLFENTNPNFTNVVFKVTDGELKINKRAVSLESATDTKVYDGEALVNDNVAVSGNGFADGEGAAYNVTGSQTEVGSSANAFTYTLNAGTKADNYTITTQEGTLTVTPYEEKITVTITEHGGEYTYDGTEKTVTGYDVEISNGVYTTDDFTFSGNDSVSGTNAGSYDMELTAEDFTNTNTNFTNVEFVIVDAQLVITPIDKVTVTITEKSGTATYDGTEKKVEGYDVSIDNSLYTEADFTFSGEAVAKGTKAGTYDMNVKAEDFTNTNKNFTTVEFVIVDGQLVITASADEVVVMVQENSDSKVYNGQEQSVTGYTVASISNPLYTEADFDFTGDATAKGTEVGTYDMNLAATDFVNKSTDFTNVTFKILDGQLAITPITDEVVVTITENSGTAVYDGTEKTVTGYTSSISNPLYTTADFTFSGTAVAKGTEVGTYDMEVKASDFTNTSKNFANVTFVVEDGQLEITPVTQEVTVTITENSGSFVYDGSEKTVSGYEVTSISNNLYTASDFTFSGTDSVSGTNAGTYDMELTASDFTNTNKNFANVTFVIVNGQLTITPVTDEVVVTVTENSATYTYDGTEKTVTGYEVTSISNSLYAENDFTFSGVAEAKGINAGSYDMTVVATDFANISTNFTNVRFVVVDGKLVINPVAEVTVTITENSGAEVFDGTEKSVTGYTVTSISNRLYTENNFTFSGVAEAKGTNAGSYDMEVKAEDFTNTNANFAKVTFVVVDGQLIITPVDEVAVIITENSATYVYDGTEKSVAGYEVTDISNELYKETDFSFAGTDVVKGTEVGAYDMLLTSEDFVNNNDNFKKVTFTIVDGGLTISPVSEEVIVTIKENSGRYTYDGTEKTVEGYEVTDISNDLYTVDDFEFNGEAIAKGTDAGTYDMEVKAEDFTNINETVFENVTFVVEDGELIIDPYAQEVKVQIAGKNDTVLYDGQTHSVKGYDITIGGVSEPENVQLVTLNNGSDVESLLKEEDIKLVGSDEVIQTNAGTYAQGLDASDFSIENDNFSNVVLEITDGELTITKRQVTLTSDSGSKVYDGTPLTKKKVRVSGDGFAEGEGATYNVTGKRIEVGESRNVFKYTLKENTLADNYEITREFGKLTVTPQAVNPVPENPTPDDPTPSDPTPAPTAPPVITIDDEPVPMADGPVPAADDDGPAVLGARRSNDPGAAVLGARRGTEYAVLGKRRRPETGDSLELILWYIALGMSVGAAITAATKVRKTKVD